MLCKELEYNLKKCVNELRSLSKKSPFKQCTVPEFIITGFDGSQK